MLSPLLRLIAVRQCVCMCVSMRLFEYVPTDRRLKVNGQKRFTNRVNVRKGNPVLGLMTKSNKTKENTSMY